MTDLTIRRDDRSQPQSRTTTSPRHTILLVLAAAVLGAFLVQTAWALTVPPFRGLDEHDHAYRAASVARGDWGAHHATVEGVRGELVVAPDDLVRAAHPICNELPYTDPENCSAVEDLCDGSVSVASAAARYHPLFYYLIGAPSRPFDGADALYAMRFAGAALCALFIGLAALTTRLWAKTPWPTVALLLAATPTFFFSTALAAPNGLEAASAMLVWAALLGIVRSSPMSGQTRTFLVLATVGAVPLATVRGLGVLWLLLIVGSAALLLPAGQLRQLMRRADALICTAVVAGAGALGVGWTLYSRSVDSSVGAGHISGSPWPGIPGELFVWFMQSVAAFPGRTVPAPTTVYVLVLATWVFLAYLGMRLAPGRGRTALAGLVLISVAIPIAASIATYEQLGYAWQGRYGYPYAMGFLLICGYVLDRSGPAPWPTRSWPVWVAAAVGLTVELISQLNLLAVQVATSPLSGSAAWHTPTPAVIIALNVAGVGLLAWALTRRIESPVQQ